MRLSPDYRQIEKKIRSFAPEIAGGERRKSNSMSSTMSYVFELLLKEQYKEEKQGRR